MPSWKWNYYKPHCTNWQEIVQPISWSQLHRQGEFRQTGNVHLVKLPRVSCAGDLWWMWWRISLSCVLLCYCLHICLESVDVCRMNTGTGSSVRPYQWPFGWRHLVRILFLSVYITLEYVSCLFVGPLNVQALGDWPYADQGEAEGWGRCHDATGIFWKKSRLFMASLNEGSNWKYSESAIGRFGLPMGMDNALLAHTWWVNYNCWEIGKVCVIIRTWSVRVITNSDDGSIRWQFQL